jgi:hypothetical protein
VIADVLRRGLCAQRVLEHCDEVGVR